MIIGQSYKVTNEIINLSKARHAKEGTFTGTRKENGAGNIVGIICEFVVAEYVPNFKLNSEISYSNDGYIGNIHCDIKGKTRIQEPELDYECSVPSSQINNREGIYLHVQLVGCTFKLPSLLKADQNSFNFFKDKQCYIIGFIDKKEFWDHKSTVMRKRGEMMPLRNGKFRECENDDHFLEYRFLHPISELKSLRS